MTTGRVSRGCLVSLAVLLVVVLGAAIAVRRALDPAALRLSLEARLSAALGQPVTIGTIHLRWFPPSAEGRDIRVGSGTAAAPSLALAAVRVVPRLSSLLSRPLVVDRVELNGLVVRALRRRDGTWLLPLPSGGAGGAGGTTSVDVGRIVLDGAQLLVVDEGGPRAATPPGITQIDAVMALEGGVARLDSLTARVGQSRIAGRGTASAGGLHLVLEWESLAATDAPAVFGLLGMAAPPGLAIEGPRPLALDLTVDARGSVTADGRLAASRLSFGALTLTALTSPLHLAGNRLDVQPVACSLYGGQQRGAFTANLATAPAAWSYRATVEHVDVDRLLSSTTAAKHKLSGLGRLNADLRGTTAAPIERTIAGTLALSVANGAIRDFPFLVSLNSALRLGTDAGDRDLRFEVLSATLHVADARMVTDDLTAQSGDLTLTAAGTLGFDLALDFTGRARFTRARSDDLVRRAKDLGGLRNPDGEIEVPFTVQGTAASPAFSIDMQKVLERAAAKELKRQLDRRLKQWIKIK